MSMHEVEEFIEQAVRSAAGSDYPIQKKRDLIYSLYKIQNCSDCGFTMRRTIPQRTACFFTVRTEISLIPDYNDRRDFYDNEWNGSPHNPMGVYLDNDRYVCIDSGTPVWEIMTAQGLISGEAAKPVNMMKVSTALKESLKVMPKLDKYTRSGCIRGAAMAEIPMYLLPALWLRIIFHNIFAPKNSG